MTDIDTKRLSDDLMKGAVWSASIADHHADTLTPKQIKCLYEASDNMRQAIRTIETLQARVEEWKNIATNYDKKLTKIERQRDEARAALTKIERTGQRLTNSPNADLRLFAGKIAREARQTLAQIDATGADALPVQDAEPFGFVYMKPGERSVFTPGRSNLIFMESDDWTETPLYAAPKPQEAPTDAVDVRRVAKALHENLSQQDVIGYLNAKIDCDLAAQAIIAAMQVQPVADTITRTADRLARRMGGRFVPHDTEKERG